MLKKHKMMFECIAKEETENGAIPLLQFTGLLSAISKATKKHGFNCYAKAYPKDVSEYVPTNKTYKIKTVRDIVKLTPEQFEMFIGDLREYCNTMRGLATIKKLPGISVEETWWFDWIDSGFHSQEIKVEATIKNNI
jgi:hypothetical protein